MLVGQLMHLGGIKMSKNLNEIGRFIFSIRLLEYPDGVIDWQVNSLNKDIPTEIVLMLIRAFLRNNERKYFNNYDRTFS